MLFSRLGAAVVFCLAVSVVIGQEPKKEPPQPPKTETKQPDPKVPDPKQPPDPKAPDPKQPPVDPKQPTPVPAPTGLKPGDPTQFNTVFTANAKFYQEVTNKVEQKIKVQGQDLTQSQSSTFWYEYTPLKEEAGKWSVKQKVEGLKMSIDISGNTINYDSTKADATPIGSNPGLIEFFKKLVNAEFVATIDTKSAKVERVEGKDTFIANLGTGNPAMENLLKRILTDDALKQMCDPNLGLAADAPKKPGEKWTKVVPLNLGPIGTYDVTYTFTYIGAEGDKDKVDVALDIKYTAPKDPTEGLLFRIKEGTLTSDPATKGTILYDPKLGRIASADITIKLKGNLTVSIGGTDTKVELSQEQTTSLKTTDTPLKK